MNPTITSKGTVRLSAQNGPRLIAMLTTLALVVTVMTTLYLRAPQTIRTTGSAFTLADHSYDDIERVRSQRSNVLPNVAADHSYDDIERVRSQRSNVLPNVVADHSYDDIEHIRATR